MCGSRVKGGEVVGEGEEEDMVVGALVGEEEGEEGRVEEGFIELSCRDTRSHSFHIALRKFRAFAASWHWHLNFL